MSKITTTLLPDGRTEYAATINGELHVVTVMTDGEMSPASWMSVEQVPFDCSDAFLTMWVTNLHRQGHSYGARAAANLHSRGVGDRPAPWENGYAAARLEADITTLTARNADGDAETIEEWSQELAPLTLGATVGSTLARHHQPQASYAAADKLIADARQASMEPELAPYMAAELQAAHGVLSKYGSFDKDGRFTPVIVRHHKQDGELACRRMKGNVQVEHVMPLVYKTMNDKVGDGHALWGGRVPLQFSSNPAPLQFGQAFYKELGLPQIVFMSQVEGSEALARGEAVTAYYFTPEVYQSKNKDTGELEWIIDRFTGEKTPLMRESWYSPVKETLGRRIGWGGAVATFPTYEAGDEALEELKHALQTIRDIDVQRALRSEGDLSEVIDHRVDSTQGHVDRRNDKVSFI